MVLNRWQPLWLLLCVVLAAAANRAMRPRVPYELSPGERTLTTGKLSFPDAGRELDLATVHTVSEDVHRAFARPLRVRELWIRSPEQTGQAEPDFEVFVDFGSADDPGEPRELVRRELPVLRAGVGSDARSRIRFAGADKPSYVAEGHLRIDEALPTGAAATYRIEGELQLVLREAGGVRTLSGRIEARLVWD